MFASFRNLFRVRSHSRGRWPTGPARRPRLEALEDRTLPSVLTAAGRTIAPTEGVPFSGVVASFTDADPGGTAADYTATIAWGDGQTSAGTVAANGSGGFNVSGSHTFAEEGAYDVAVTVADAGG